METLTKEHAALVERLEAIAMRLRNQIGMMETRLQNAEREIRELKASHIYQPSQYPQVNWNTMPEMPNYRPCPIPTNPTFTMPYIVSEGRIDMPTVETMEYFPEPDLPTQD